MKTTRLVVVGGFLGAGKTTLLLSAARRLVERGYRVGLVTNDQGSNLVNTALLSLQGLPVMEVSGSCFCCAFPDLLQALGQLEVTAQPDIILAEPVGSCTDLISTVLRPLMAYHPQEYDVAPLTIVKDVCRDERVFSPNVSYLSERQIEEAEILLLNKIDLLNNDLIMQRQTALRSLNPHARLFNVSAHTGEGVDAWLDTVLGLSSTSQHTMAIDYDRYAEAEAELVWLNAEGLVNSSRLFSARGWTSHLLDTVVKTLDEAQIAHIKLHIDTPLARFKASITQSNISLSWDVDSEDAPVDQLKFIAQLQR